jgi:hypothetical protein
MLMPWLLDPRSAPIAVLFLNGPPWKPRRRQARVDKPPIILNTLREDKRFTVGGSYRALGPQGGASHRVRPLWPAHSQQHRAFHGALGAVRPWAFLCCRLSELSCSRVGLRFVGAPIALFLLSVFPPAWGPFAALVGRLGALG